MKALTAIAGVAALAALPAYADCRYPIPPSRIPDGRTAKLQEMLAGEKVIQNYNTRITAYNACIDKELEDTENKLDAEFKVPDNLTPQQKAQAIADFKNRKVRLEQTEAQKHNAAVDQLQSIADRFNEQVKVFKARTADKQG